MKQFKLNPKTPTKGGPGSKGADSKGTTRQEIDSLTRHVTEKIVKNPDKAARIFKNWLEQKPATKTKKTAA
jgi:hypothetical protein